MKTRQLFILTLIVSILFSCSTGASSSQLAGLKVIDPNLATVTVIRKSQLTGSAGKLDVTLDAKKIARIGSGQLIEFQVEPGQHFVAVPLKTITGPIEEVESFDAEAGQRFYFYYSMSIYGDVCRLERLTQEKAEEILSKKRYRVVALSAQP
jgi:hypothetical protein